MKLLLVWLDIRNNSVLNPHHGLAWIAGSMRENGHEVRCIHIRREEDLGTLKAEIKKYSPDCLGFSLVTNQRKYLDPFATECRKVHRGVIIAGGVHATLSPSETLRCKDLDGICIGEGERAMVALGDRMDRCEPYHDIPSLRWRVVSNGVEKFVGGGARQFVRDLSEIPYPDYSVFNMDEVISHGAAPGYIPILVSRGCPYVCTYCGNKALKDVYPRGNGYFRMMTPAQIVDYLKYVTERFPVKGFNFADDLFVSNLKNFTEFSRLYTKKINLPYVCNARVETLNNKEIALLLKETGCQQVSFGIESGDEEYRRKYLKRNYTNEQILKATSILREVGIPFSSYNIIGFPFETKEQMEKTVEINRLMRPDSGMVFFFYPYPGTELYNICKENGLLNPEEMTDVDGFMERPVIKLTKCSDKDCVMTHRKLFLYFKTRKASSLLKIDSSRFDRLLYRLMLSAPRLFLSLGKQKYIPRFLKRESA